LLNRRPASCLLARAASVHTPSSSRPVVRKSTALMGAVADTSDTAQSFSSEISSNGIALPYRTFDKLRSVPRSEVVENKRLDAALALVAEMQAGCDLQRSQHAPRRTGQTDHMFGIPDGSVGNGYVKRGRKPGRRTDFMNDPAVIARREKALARMAAAAAGVPTPFNVDAVDPADSGRANGRLDDVLAFLMENSGKPPEAPLP
jgi:hypothetical protein